MLGVEVSKKHASVLSEAGEVGVEAPLRVLMGDDGGEYR